MINEKSFYEKGGMLMEILLSIAIFFTIIPFLLKFHQYQINKKENILILKEMEEIKQGLEKYIEINKDKITNTIGSDIIRISLKDLEDIGFYISPSYDYKLRILKTKEYNSISNLQGVIILNDKNIKPLRTRQIVNSGVINLGFIEQNKIYGAFSSWKVNASSYNLKDKAGIVNFTKVQRNNENYLYRLPSDRKNDSKMLSSLNLYNNDILNVNSLYSQNLKINKSLKVEKANTNNLSFDKLISYDNIFIANNIYTDILSSTNTNLAVNNIVKINNYINVENYLTNYLTIENLELNNVKNIFGKVKNFKVNNNFILEDGKIEANNIYVLGDGSQTIKLRITDKILDANYVWNVKNNSLALYDLKLQDFEKMALTLKNKRIVNSGIAKDLTVFEFLQFLEKMKDNIITNYESLNL